MAQIASNRYSEIMTITNSDHLAAELDRKRLEAGLESLDAAAEALLAGAMDADATDADRLAYSDGELRALIAEGDASGAAIRWDATEVRDEVRGRFVAPRS
jgi:hypothetical protein